jgi:hypothetical protein
MDNKQPGHLTLMWNDLFKRAYNYGCDYFIQCGDDIIFQTKGWINDCISTLQKYNNIGVTAPLSDHNILLTQTFVSRKHMELFNYYFPPEIINWYCDDWINNIYKLLNRFFPLDQHKCINIGGNPRYTINNDVRNIDGINNTSICRIKQIHDYTVKRDFERVVNIIQ